MCFNVSKNYWNVVYILGIHTDTFLGQMRHFFVAVVFYYYFKLFLHVIYFKICFNFLSFAEQSQWDMICVFVLCMKALSHVILSKEFYHLKFYESCDLHKWCLLNIYYNLRIYLIICLFKLSKFTWPLRVSDIVSALLPVVVGFNPVQIQNFFHSLWLPLFTSCIAFVGFIFKKWKKHEKTDMQNENETDMNENENENEKIENENEWMIFYLFYFFIFFSNNILLGMDTSLIVSSSLNHVFCCSFFWNCYK